MHFKADVEFFLNYFSIGYVLMSFDFHFSGNIAGSPSNESCASLEYEWITRNPLEPNVFFKVPTRRRKFKPESNRFRFATRTTGNHTTRFYRLFIDNDPFRPGLSPKNVIIILIHSPCPINSKGTVSTTYVWTSVKHLKNGWKKNLSTKLILKLYLVITSNRSNRVKIFNLRLFIYLYYIYFFL